MEVCLSIDTGELINKQFGKLHVVEFLGSKGQSKYRCQCACGKTTIVPRRQLLNGRSTSCGSCFSVLTEGNHMRYVVANNDSFIFDKHDLPLIIAHRWYIDRNGYAATKIKAKTFRLTRLLLSPDNNTYIDHINGNPRDNCKSNLRLSTFTENQRNMRLPSHNSTGYKSVSFRRDRNKYRACISVGNKTKHIGYFDSAENAALAYDDTARQVFGSYACLNFPKEEEQSCRRVAS